ncbi:MAG: hypothetical protein PHX70_12235 [Clostridium sp.]|nr:hypothetical protein [Clostridium sp.]
MKNDSLENLYSIKHKMINKVPEITIFFWIIKILTTGMGEVTSDYLAKHIDPVIAVVLAGCSLIVTFVIQFLAPRYIPWIYWLNVIMVSIFGTMMADVLHVGLGIPYIVSTMFFIVMLSVILIIWYLREKTLSIHSIYTRRREFFYWATVLTTFALGTAAGDMTATTMRLGYFYSGIFFMVLIAIPAIAYLVFGVSEIFTFWFAYIITRPLGASFADWMGVPISRGGLGIGTGVVSIILTTLILIFVSYMALTRKDISNNKKY